MAARGDFMSAEEVAFQQKKGKKVQPAPSLSCLPGLSLVAGSPWSWMFRCQVPASGFCECMACQPFCASFGCCEHSLCNLSGPSAGSRLSLGCLSPPNLVSYAGGLAQTGILTPAAPAPLPTLHALSLQLPVYLAVLLSRVCWHRCARSSERRLPRMRRCWIWMRWRRPQMPQLPRITGPGEADETRLLRQLLPAPRSSRNGVPGGCESILSF